VTATELGALTRPLLSVTVKLNVRVVVVVTMGAVKASWIANKLNGLSSDSIQIQVSLNIQIHREKK
jgi:hypothetical protein